MPLTHQWKFNDNLEDSIGINNFNDIGGIITFQNGIVEKCLNYPDVSYGNSVFTYNPLPSTTNAEWTISFWMRNIEEDVFLTFVDNNVPRLYFSRSTTKNTFRVYFNDGQYSGDALIKLGTNSLKTQFTHIVFIYRTSSRIPKLYINGIEQIGSALDFVQSFTTNLIKKPSNLFYISNTNYGYQLEDLRIYDEAISDAEVSKIYNSACSEVTTETKLYIQTQPTGQYQNVLFGNAVVQLRDVNNQVVTSSDMNVIAEVYSGSTTSGGVLLGTLMVKAVNGVATFSDLRINKAGTFKVRFYTACSSITEAISNNIVLTSFLGTISLDEPDLTLYLESTGTSDNNNITLFTYGYGRGANLLTLFLKSELQKTVPLFTRSASFKNRELNLFLKAQLTEGLNLYVEGRPKRPNSLDLFLQALLTNSIPLITNSKVEEYMPLYTNSLIEGNRTLFVKSSPQEFMPLYVASQVIPSQQQYLTLAIRGISNIGDVDPTEFWNGVNLFIVSSFGDQMPLYIPVDDIALKNGNMPLFTKNFIQKYGSSKYLNMYLKNNILGKSKSLDLLIKGDGSSFGFKPFDGSMSMFIERDVEYFARHLNLFIHGKTTINNNSTLIIKGANLINSNVNMVMPIIANIFSDGVDLYTHGFNEE